VAYAAWCADVLLHPGPEPVAPTLAARPWLLLLAPLLAALLEAGGRSPGLSAWGLRFAPTGEPDAPAPPARLAFRALLLGLQALVVTAPLLLLSILGTGGGRGGPWLLATLGLAALLGAASLLDPLARGLPERLAGLRPARGALRVPGRPPGALRSATTWAVLALVLLTLYVGVRVTRVDLSRLVEGGRDARQILGRLLDPDWSIAGSVVASMVETVFLALMASVLAVPVAFALSFLGARTLTRGSFLGAAAYAVTRAALNVTRSVEPVVWAIVFSLWVGIGPFAGMLALFVHSVASLGKLYSEAIEAIDPGPLEAIRSTGARPVQVLRYGVVPQVVLPFLSFTVYRWDINVRMATVLGFVGGGGIGKLLIDHQFNGYWSKVGTILLFVILVVWAMDWASSRARQRLS
jgi:phosphonate transport system permease protein